MQLTSTFGHEKPIPKQFTCDAEGKNPPLYIEDIPEGTKSLVLICDDLDSPSGVFLHWMMWNIQPHTTVIEEGSVPEQAIQGKNSAGDFQYCPPCPHQGEHRYVFTIYALDIDITLPPESDREEAEELMVGHVLAKSELMGMYKREGK